MCFNAPISFATWAFAWVCGYILWRRNHRNDRWIAAFLMTFSSIQLLEGLAWLNIDSPQRLSLITRFILIFLWLQPLVNCIAGYLDTRSGLLGIMALVFVGALIFTIVQSTMSAFTTVKGPHCHLVWERTRNTHPVTFIGPSPLAAVYLLGLLVPILFIENVKARIAILTVGVVTFALSTRAGPEFSTMWCWSAILVGVAALITN